MYDAALDTGSRSSRGRRQSLLEKVPWALYAVLCVAAPVYILHHIADATTEGSTAGFVPPHRLHENCSSSEPRAAGCPWPAPMHMLFGLLAVAVGQVFVLIYYTIRRLRLCGLARPKSIQIRYPDEKGTEEEEAKLRRDELDP